MKKSLFPMIGYVFLWFLAGGLLLQMCRSSNQASMSFVIEAEFTGEYRLGGGEWKPLTEDTRVSGFDGDLVLKGQFSEEPPISVSFYLNHIGMTISVNGEQVFESGRVQEEMPEMMCGSSWSSWLYENANPEDEIEIRLHNPHSYGNANAYNEFLDSMYFGSGIALQKQLSRESMPFQITGIGILVISVALLGMALGYLLQRLPAGSLLWSAGLLSLFMGGYFLMDTRDIEFRSTLIVWNTCMRRYCIMFAALAFTDMIRKILTGKRRRAAGYLTALQGAADGILLLLSLADVVALYDTGLFWAAAQGIVSLGMLVLCIFEYRQDAADHVPLLSCMGLLSAELLAFLNARMGFWQSGIVVKVLFTLLFIFHLIRAVKMVAVNHRESVKAKKLAGELRSSRIVLAMSQIRTHFIFNVLAAISEFCKQDAEKADHAIICFSRYLRNNIDIMEDDKPIAFTKELEHLKDYIVLEQIRFGDKITFVEDTPEKDFNIPPLVLQPVVENAIKHGIFDKDSGGTITLRTRKEQENIIITITDDGVGFAPGEGQRKGSVGLKNVRFRLEQMMNGSFGIESSPGKGTTVTIRLPQKEGKG